MTEFDHNIPPEQVAAAVKLMGHEPINPIGACFDSSAIQLLQEDIPANTTLCHGLGKASRPDQIGQEMAHAWIEADGWAYDTTWGVRQPIEKYRAGMSLTYVIEYPRVTAIQLWKDHGYPGPWSKTIIEYFQRTGRWDKEEVTGQDDQNSSEKTV
jgi:hypothetical protein